MILNENYLNLKSIKYSFNQNYGLTYISKIQYELALKYLSLMRKDKEISFDDWLSMSRIFKHYYKNSIKIAELDRLQPRFIAQKFIGKKNIRHFIFKRDGYCCLKCYSPENLTLDHISPVSKGGENKIQNLQTLCKSCNSRKSDTFKDYRNGSR